MNDKIMNLYEDLIEKFEIYSPSEMIAISKLLKDVYKAGSASRDDEVGELVETIDRMMVYQENLVKSPKLWFQKVVDIGSSVLFRYTRTPCPECCPGGVVETREARPEDYICDCGACHGRGYRWERK